MKRKAFKRLLSIAMAAVLLIAMIPVTTLAATVINEVSAEIMAPVAGRVPSYQGRLLTDHLEFDTVDSGYGACQQNGVLWFHGDTPMQPTDTFAVGETYTVRLTVVRESTSYELAANPTLRINGNAAYHQYGNIYYVSMEYTFPAVTGFTVSFNSGGGSGTMAPVTGFAGSYTLPPCSFTPPTGKVFDAWMISTDPNRWMPGENITVASDVTVTALWKTPSSRTQIFDIVATSEDLDSIPVLYGKVEIPTFTITAGAPAYIAASSGNLTWQRKEGDEWKNYYGARFTAGEWRISTQVRIDRDSGLTHELGNPTTLTVNGKTWTPENGTGIPSVYPTYSMLFFRSPSYTIVDDPNIQPPTPIESVKLNLLGYAAGAPISNAITASNSHVNVVGQVFYEADSLQDLFGGNPESVQPASGSFSADKAYAVMLGIEPNDGYTFDTLTNANVTLNGALGEIMEYIEGDTFSGIYLLPPLNNAAIPFVDVKPADYFYTPVLWALMTNITTGTDATHFSPYESCIRAQVVTFLWRAAGCPEPMNNVNPFVDVKTGDYFYKAVLWAAENGITTGADATHFDPYAPCSRSQIVTFLWRYEYEPNVSGTIPFVDVPANQYYSKAVLWAVQEGITTGTDASHFSPFETCTRSQIVTFLYRLYN
ncbi:MAG: S-layer homology domain-containing protein [Clostridia bacterium]|nr:S-layer homology domain-containing protein [Clostridia bacterium]